MKFIKFAGKWINTEKILNIEMKVSQDKKDAYVIIFFEIVDSNGFFYNIKEEFLNELPVGGYVGEINAQLRLSELLNELHNPLQKIEW